MDKQEITKQLLDKHAEFANLIVSLSDPDFIFSLNDKWTAGQQMDHILRSVFPLARVLKSPEFLLAQNFGKSGGGSMKYEDLVNKYSLQLKDGAKASGRFIPEIIELTQKEELKYKLQLEVSNLYENLNYYSEKELDEYLLPHPLLGSVTIREMLYFTIYHVQHHQRLTLSNLGR